MSRVDKAELAQGAIPEGRTSLYPRYEPGDRVIQLGEQP